MSKQIVNGTAYLLPGNLNSFQLKLYAHLINWKWCHIIRDVGYYKYKGSELPYDAILPKKFIHQRQLPHIFQPALQHLTAHRIKNPFRIHKHFYHMASSQAANINLFLPILHAPQVNDILASLKSDFKSLATDQLDKGYCIEYWGGNYGGQAADKGLLNDKAAQSGTDSDLAIAYRNHDVELCLWLIEHKLTEAEFTTCGGYKSKGRTDKKKHDCKRSFSEILKNMSFCYYHDKCKFKYWDITDANQAFFVGHASHKQCPFQGGMNQLWRNQLLALAIEQDPHSPFKHVSFSVVRHPRNRALYKTLAEYQALIASNPKFFTFTSADVINAATNHADPSLQGWINWYKNLYDV
jgi:hypothetical protein